MIVLAAVMLMASCSDDEKITPKDYGMKTFAADMKYKKEGSGMAKDFNCKQQTFFKFGKADAAFIGEHGTDTWTRFDLLPKLPKDKDAMGGGIPEIDNPLYNLKTTKVQDWDIVFTQYYGDVYGGRGKDGVIMPYFLAGILINPDKVQVGLVVEDKNKSVTELAQAFADLKLSDVATVKYKNNMDAIGTKFRSMKGMGNYVPNLHAFFIVKRNNGDIYKLRFIGFWGGTEKKNKVFKCEYALMK